MRWSTLLTTASSALLASQCLGFNHRHVPHGNAVKRIPDGLPTGCISGGSMILCPSTVSSPRLPNADAVVELRARSATSTLPQRTQTAPASNPTHGQTSKMVFAHHIVGVAATHTLDTWVDDITRAKAVGIDGFALNIAAQDSTTDTQLGNAFTAANKVGGFKLFFSFDYASQGAWSIGAIVGYINQYGSNGAYYQYNGKPLVSTFEGADNAGDWPSIKSQTTIFLVPAWSSKGCETPGNFPYIDGMFSWDAWPVGASNMDTTEDSCWQQHLNGKPYMMGAAPLFYTSMPQYNKNWVWRGDSLWHDRWQQAAKIQPQWVQIISWNDFGESHYVGPLRGQGVPQSAQRYADNMAHDALLELLPYYIDNYKYGSTSVTSDKLVYWYRLTPCRNGDNGGTRGNAPWQAYADPCDVVEDVIVVAAVVKSGGSTVTIQVGSGQRQSFQAENAGVNLFTYSYGGDRGDVQMAITRGGQTVASARGPAIQNSPSSGQTNFNPVAGSSSTS